MLITALFVAAVAFLISFLTVILTIPVARHFRLVDDPQKRKHPAQIHTGVIPRAGGLPLFIGFLIPMLLFVPVNQIILGIIIGAFLIVVMGSLDDYFDISPYIRFFFNIVIVAIVILFGLGVPYISNPFGGIIRLDTFSLTFDFFGKHQFLFLSNLTSLIWIVTLMNFVNWSKGVDGQMPGFVVISSIFLGLLSFRLPGHDIAQQSVTLLSFIIAGTFAGFLVWNVYPQKIMPGYGGGALAGFFLGVLSILSFGKVGVLTLLLSVPLIDAFYVMVRRIKNLKSPFWGDASHFHHRLLEIGWGKRRVAFFYWIISLLFGVAALFFHGIQKILALLMVSISLGVFIIIINHIKKSGLS